MGALFILVVLGFPKGLAGIYSDILLPKVKQLLFPRRVKTLPPVITSLATDPVDDKVSPR